ncbi:MAG: hypothetical protein DA443_02540, partial [Bacteroidetes bacterium]
MSEIPSIDKSRLPDKPSGKDEGPEGSGSKEAGLRSGSGSPNGKRSLFTRFLDFVEWLGNLLPHPVTLFAIFALGVVLI